MILRSHLMCLIKQLAVSSTRLLCGTLVAPWRGRGRGRGRALSFPLPTIAAGTGKGKAAQSTMTTMQSSSDPHDKFHQVFHSESDGGWENCWKKGLTPWDLRQPTPILVHLHNTGALPKGKALIPGCGSGYDVVAIACPERYVVGLDLSEDALNRAAELSSSSPSADYCTFLKADFFKWRPSESFDLIFDYTFFCAIEPSLRSDWAIKVRDLLKSDGELLTLMFPISDHEGGPPYKLSVTDYEDVLHPLGFKAISIKNNELAIEPRKGREKIARWKRSPPLTPSL